MDFLGNYGRSVNGPRLGNAGSLSLPATSKHPARRPTRLTTNYRSTIRYSQRTVFCQHSEDTIKG
jgi:hypothetical protein